MIKLTPDQETTLIARAKAGDDQAKIELLANYAPAIHAGARAFARLVPNAEDAVAAATAGVLCAIRDFDSARCPRLAGMVRNRIQDQLWELASQSIGSMNIPRTILARYFRVMSDPRVAGSVSAAREVGSEYQISGQTIFSVWSALNQRHLDVEPVSPSDPTACIEDRILSDIALGSMDVFDREVVSMRYGFAGHREMPIEEVAVLLDVTTLRARQALARGLASGRKALSE